MSGQQYRRKPRGANAPNFGGGGRRPMRNQPEKSVLNDGVYKNEPFMHAATSLVGYVTQVKVRNEKIYEGIFRTFSPSMEVVLERVHVVDGKLPPKEQIVHSMIIAWKDVVSIYTANVDLESALVGGEGFTDASISRFNGRVCEKELQPWECNSDDGPELESGVLDTLDTNANGWDATLMFKANESKFNYKSDYDPSLKTYTTELVKEDTEEYRNRELLAERQALEIEGNPMYRENVDPENADEELMYSAVLRGTDESPAAQTPGNGAIAMGKYVAPHLRQGTASPAQRPQQLVVMPSQPETPRTHVQPTTTLPPVVPIGAGDNAPASVAQGGPGMIRLNGEARKDEIEKPLAPLKAPTAASETPSDKAKATVSANAKSEQQNPRAETFNELKEFKQNFKLPDSDARDSKHGPPPPLQQQATPSSSTVTPMATPQPQVPLSQQQQPSQPQTPSLQTPVELNRHGYDDRNEAKEELKEDSTKKSNLNALAKEFYPSKSYNPQQQQQQPQQRSLPPQTPPRPPSTVSSPIFYSMQPNVYPLVTPAANAPPSRGAMVQNKRATVSARPDVNLGPQAMAGAPLVTQQVVIPGPTMIPNQVMPVYQPSGMLTQVIRVIPQGGPNMMIDPNQGMFVPMTSLTSQQGPHPAAALGAPTHHVIAGASMSGSMHNPHAAGVPVGPPQQSSGAPTPTPMHQYGQHPQAGSSMPLPTTSGTPQPPPPSMQMYPPGGPGGMGISHQQQQQMHPASLQHMPNQPSTMLYQVPLSQFSHAYAAAAAASQQSVAPGSGPGVPGGQQQQQQHVAAPHHQPPPPSMGQGQTSHLVMHHPQMMMAPQGQGAGGHLGPYMPMPGTHFSGIPTHYVFPTGMTQGPALTPHQLGYQMYSVQSAGAPHTFTLGQ